MSLVRLGPAGWSYEDWKGTVYPFSPPAGFKPLRFIADFFDCAEINSTYYRVPEARMSASLARLVAHNPRFQFTAKLFKKFTHERGTPWAAAEMRAYLEGLRPLIDEGRLAGILLQFPWSFRNAPDSRDHLARLAEAMPDVVKIVEVRHDSWNVEATYEFLASHRLGFCNIDQPALHGCLGPTTRATGPVAYVRLHGRNAEKWFGGHVEAWERYDYLYNAKQLEEWAERIRELAKKAENVFVITNNHYKGQAAANALELKALLTGEKVEAPPALAGAYSALKSVAKPATARPIPGQLFREREASR